MKFTEQNQRKFKCSDMNTNMSKIVKYFNNDIENIHIELELNDKDYLKNVNVYHTWKKMRKFEVDGETSMIEVVYWEKFAIYKKKYYGSEYLQRMETNFIVPEELKPILDKIYNECNYYICKINREKTDLLENNKKISNKKMNSLENFEIID